MDDQKPIIEQWRPIPAWPGYEASSLGRIRSWRLGGRGYNPAKGLRRSKPHVMSQDVNRNGYQYVGLSCGDGRSKTVPVHVLVLEAFVGPRPEGHETCHGPLGRLDNRPSNLRWDTRRANSDDRQRHQLAKGNPRFKLLEADALRIIARLHTGEHDKAIAADFPCSRQTVVAIRLGYSWAHLPRPWGQRPLYREVLNNEKLCQQGVETIVQLLHDGDDDQTLAARFGVSICTISSIRVGKAWLHVARPWKGSLRRSVRFAEPGDTVAKARK